MISDIWRWLVSEQGTAWRIGVGAAVLLGLLAWDIRRRGWASERWREYLFLLAATAIAGAYGVVNDQITLTISWEYFVYGKELYHLLRGPMDVDMPAARLEAVLVGVQATWWAGLLMGAAVLLANNPRPNRPRLAYRELVRLMLLPLATAALLGAIGGILGRAGLLTWASEDFQMMVREDIFRPYRFMAVWGIHLGGYVGALVGTGLAVWHVRQRRKALARQNPPEGCE
ncbi:MAG TPA: hypothetical protein PK082_03480 [Phycisphaerae bacterium]|nr:hypothetical protein [Phycisphaerae bacterium]